MLDRIAQERYGGLYKELAWFQKLDVRREHTRRVEADIGDRLYEEKRRA